MKASNMRKSVMKVMVRADAFIVEALTDNQDRTASEVGAAFSKFGGSLGETGSVSFMFDRVGQIIYTASVADSDSV